MSKYITRALIGFVFLGASEFSAVFGLCALFSRKGHVMSFYVFILGVNHRNISSRLTRVGLRSKPDCWRLACKPIGVTLVNQAELHCNYA